MPIDTDPIRPQRGAQDTLRVGFLSLATTVVAAAAGLWIGDERTVDASLIQGIDDADHDGISDLAEVVALTNPGSSDSDGDGYSDLEELARGTNPSESDIGLGAGTRAIGLSTTGNGSEVSVDVALYLPNGDYTGLDLEFGVFVPVPGADPVQIPLPHELTFLNGSLRFAQGAELGSLIIHFDVILPQAVFESFGWLPVYATAGPVATGPTTADAQTIIYEGEALLSLEPVVAEAAFSSTAQVGGIANRPIEPSTELPVSMTSNQLCFQATSVAGTIGGLTELVVTEADCVDADFFYCASTCLAALGTSRTIVDPLALIGG